MKIQDLLPAYEVEAVVAKSSIAPSSRADETLQQMNACCLCGTRLKFLHLTNFTTLKVKERAQCPACGIKTKEEDFTLQ